MTSLIKTIGNALCCCALTAASAAHAHYLWIESSDGGAKLYYGEPDVLLKEKSPGKLDTFQMPKAMLLDAASKSNTAAVSRANDHFAIANSKGATAVLVTDESLEVRDLTKNNLGYAKSNYYARNGQAGDGGASPLALDVQRRGPMAFTVLYRGQALKGAKLEVIAPNTWVQEHKTDAQGVVEINAPWRGQYVVHVLHVDKTAGEFAGKKYDNLRNHLTYSFVKAEGADPGPAQPPKTPLD